MRRQFVVWTRVIALLLCAAHLCEGSPLSFDDVVAEVSNFVAQAKDFSVNATANLGPKATDFFAKTKDFVAEATEYGVNATENLGPKATDFYAKTKDFVAEATDFGVNATANLGAKAKDFVAEATDFGLNVTADLGPKIAAVQWSCWGLIIGCFFGGLLFFILGVHWFLLCLGFGALGPVAGTLAAFCQPSAAPSVMFRCMQSTGMTFFQCWQGQMAFTMAAWFIMIPLSLLAGGGAGYAGYLYIPSCQDAFNCLGNGTVCDALNATVVASNVTTAL